jgi:dTDP-glucose pyrophosphorylase
MLPVGNRPLLEYQIETMRSWGISEVLIVVGRLGYAIADALGHGERQNVTIRYVEQSETLGLAHALGKLESLIDSSFVLLLGDIYFVLGDMSRVIAEVVEGQTNGVLVSKLDQDPEMIRRNFAIIADASGRVSQVIEKPHWVPSQIKGCGLYVFDQHVFDAIRRTPRTAMRDEYEITDTIQIMINDGHRVVHRPIAMLDMNLTVPEDLLSVNLMDLRRRGLSQIVGQDVTLAQGTCVQNSVIGDRVVVDHPVRITNSLVFPDVHVEREDDIDSVILYREHRISCSRKDLRWRSGML